VCEDFTDGIKMERINRKMSRRTQEEKSMTKNHYPIARYVKMVLTTPLATPIIIPF
jgi:hypothetical protein